MQTFEPTNLSTVKKFSSVLAQSLPYQGIDLRSLAIQKDFEDEKSKEEENYKNEILEKENLLKQSLKECDELKVSLQNLISQIDNDWKEYKSNLSEEMSQAVFQIAESVVGEELNLKPQILKQAIEKLLEETKEEKHKFLQIHPEDLNLLEKNDLNSLNEWISKNKIEIKSDEKIKRGSVRLNTEHLTHEYNPFKKIDQLKQSLGYSSGGNL